MGATNQGTFGSATSVIFVLLTYGMAAHAQTPPAPQQPVQDEPSGAPLPAPSGGQPESEGTNQPAPPQPAAVPPQPAAAPPAAPPQPAGPPPPVTGYPGDTGSQNPPPAYGAQPPPPRGYGYYEPPPPPAPVPDETVHTHDGFYFRTGFGLGYGNVVTTAEDVDGKLTFSGGGWLFDLLFGGTIANTVALGAGFVTMELTDPQATAADGSETVSLGETDGGLGLVNFGPFVDVFFGPHSGGHVGGMLGFGSIGLEDENEDPSSGLGVAVFGGYDFWVSDQWALGVNLRYMYLRGKREFSDSNITLIDRSNSFGVMFSALYH